jgi:hypothetical protein
MSVPAQGWSTLRKTLSCGQLIFLFVGESCSWRRFCHNGLLLS